MQQDPVYSAEAMLCAALLESPGEYDGIRWLDRDRFGNPENRAIFVAIEYVLRDYPESDADELHGRVRHCLTEYGQTAALQRLIVITAAYPVVPGLAATYAHSIHETYQHEMLKGAAMELTRLAASGLDLDEKARMMDDCWQGILAGATSQAGWEPIEGLHTVNEFLHLGESTFEWVIPGMLERQERFMLIAPEKAGKTVLTRQVALMLAAGHHPFCPGYAIAPMRTLIVDLENPAGAARRDFRRQIHSMDDLWSDDNGNAYVLHRPAGIHLGDGRDRAMLRQAVDRLGIDLLCLSPIYKAYDGLDKSWEEQAFGVQKPLDRLREDFNLAIWMEHHAPWGEKGNRDLRPIGSSRWGRWLDYQAALVPDTPTPPFHRMWWRAIRRDERKMAPRALVRSERTASWKPEWKDGEEDGFMLALDYAVST